MFSKDKDDQHHKDKDGDDDSDSGWSEDEKKSQTQTQAQQSLSGPKDKGAVLAAGEKLPSGAVIKKSVRINGLTISPFHFWNHVPHVLARYRSRQMCLGRRQPGRLLRSSIT